MKNSQKPRIAVPENDLACGRKHSRRHPKPAKIYGNVPKTADAPATVDARPEIRISPAAQLEIIKLYLQGCSLCEIARQTHRARQTVTKICRSDEIQAKIQEVRGKLLGSSDKWVESITYAVHSELDGRVALQLAERFGAIPVIQQPQQTTLEPIDRERSATAAVLGTVALERGNIFGSELPKEEGRTRKNSARPPREKHQV
jgi:hypothetical protein